MGLFEALKNLSEAFKKRDYELTETLIEYLTDLFSKKKYDGHTLLTYILQHNDLIGSEDNLKELFEILLSKGADVSRKTEFGKTPLMIASRKGYYSICKLLIENNANVDDKCYSGFTALMVASFCGYIEICKLLIDCDADLDAKNCIGQSPLLIATKTKHYDISKLLIEKGADVNTVLMYVSLNGNKEICELLIDAGVELDVSNIYYSEFYKKKWISCARKLTFNRRKHLLDAYDEYY